MTTILYPAAIDNNISIPPSTDNVTPVTADVSNTLRAAIISIEKELGVNPATIYGTVKNRLDVLESMLTQGGGTVFMGDLVSGYLGMVGQQVIGFYGRPLSNAAPSAGESYVWNGTQWTPEIVNNFTPNGDLGGDTLSQIVIGIQKIPISSTVPTANQVLQYNGSQYVPTTIIAALSGDVTGSQSATTMGQRKSFLLMGA